MHPRDKKTSVGRTVDLLPFRRGKERGRARSEAVSSSLVHAFPPVKTLRKGQRRVDHNAPARLIFGLHTSPLPLHYPTSCLCCFLPPPNLLLFFFSTLLLLSSFPLLPSGLSSPCFPSFFLPSFFFLPQMNWRASPPPPVDLGTWGCETVVYIFFFSIVMVLIINIIATEQFTQVGSGGQLQQDPRSST